MEYLSHYLKAIRAAQGKTQQYMAEILHIDQGKYSRIERGIDKISVEDLVIIAKEFGIEVTQLLEMAKQPPFPSKK